jgi:two-component system chemotaxis sensor kinase CheA
MPHAELATAVSRLRYEPVARLLAPAAESARQILSTPGRAPVDLAIKDHGLRVDGARWRPFFAALVHVARHQATGAGETEEERLSGCKEPRLAFSLEVVLDDAEVVVRVADDGPGLATEVIRAAGRRAGRATGSPDNLVDAAFTETSGRPGVGLAAARQECLELGGAVEVTTSAGEGTTITFRFPADGAGVLAAA